MKKKCSFCSTIYAEKDFFCPECAGLAYDLIDDEQAKSYQSGRQPSGPASSSNSSSNSSPRSASGASSASGYGTSHSTRPASVQDAYRVERVGRPSGEAKPSSAPSEKQKQSAASTNPAHAQKEYSAEHITPPHEKKTEEVPKQKQEPAASPAPKKKNASSPIPSAHAMSTVDLDDVEARRMKLLPITADWYTKESRSPFSHKASGKLKLEKDGILYHITSGSLTGYMAFGLLGMYFSKKKAQKNGKEAFIPYEDIAKARKAEKGLNLFSSIVLEMKNGEQICFYLLKSKSGQDEFVNLINDLIAVKQKSSN